MPDFSYRTWLKTWREAGSPKFPESRWIILVGWDDAATAEDSIDARLMPSYTAGFLVGADAKQLKVGLSIFGDDDSRDVITIPARAVTYIVEILELPHAN